MKDQFKEHMDAAKIEIASTLQHLAHSGIPMTIIISAMGSSTGNLVGILLKTDDAEEIGDVIDAMKPAMVKDAQSAYRFAKQRSN